MGQFTRRGLELWGGLECSIVAIGDDVRDQTAETGHQARKQDLALFAGLGLKKLRYPVLWEAVSPDKPDKHDWAWHDERLAEIRRLGLTPIAGLIHHGSGPHYTNLLDPAFPRLLAAHATSVAERYPWIEDYTPVNEPLTTARFSGLYGHWRPHKSDQASFLRALINQCMAVVLSMESIRKVRPQARLIQTEDIGKTFSTPLLAYQADYENERRWLSLDLLCGRVDVAHPWWDRLLRYGIREEELQFLLAHATPPDIMGVNHYLTSERYLDERVSSYPAHLHGGNGRHEYADAEAVRVQLCDDATGPAARLKEVWARYQIPIAVTEAHHGCSRDEQLRWLMEVWNAAHNVREDGVDVRAVTIWSLLGTYDWNSLLTKNMGHYEAGAFDVRSQSPRPTALARAAASLARRSDFDHPVLDQPGWWRREGRFYEPVTPRHSVRNSRRLVIAGATGTLGRALSRVCAHRGLDHVLLSRSQMDITDLASVTRNLLDTRPWAVINAAGYVNLAKAHDEKDRCLRENVGGAANLALVCNEFDIPFVTFSSDLVFDGSLGRPYQEPDAPSPRCVYGLSKALSEEKVLYAHPEALIVRTSAFFGPWDKFNFAYSVLSNLEQGRPIHVSKKVNVSPTYVPDLAHAVLDLLIDGETGVWHLSNGRACSWYEFALRIADQARMSKHLILNTEDDPRDTSLASARGSIMPTLEGSIERFLRENEVLRFQ
jgi:dTDP-4-dehydrorhamnose reductase